MRERAYDRERAVAYARRWALGRNPAYYDFTPLGGDCTNYISQCLYAGAGRMNFTPITGWFYRYAGDRTASWTGVEYLYRFLTKNSGPGPRAELTARSALALGDVIQLSFDGTRFAHSLLVTQTQPTLLICAHTADSLDRPFDSYMYEKARFLHITGVG